MQNVIGMCNQNTVQKVGNVNFNFCGSMRIRAILLWEKNNINVQRTPATTPQNLKHSNSEVIKIKLNNFFLIRYSIVEGLYYLVISY